MIYINAYIDSKYLATDFSSIHEVWKKLLQFAQFGILGRVLSVEI